MKLNEKIVNAFACPDCSGDLICDLDKQSIHCVSCSSLYLFENNIPVLLLPDTREEFKKNIDGWGKNELVPHPEFIVKEMFRVLKLGGFIFVTVPFTVSLLKSR